MAATCFHLIKSLKTFFDLLPGTARQTVAVVLITSRLDYCNSLYAGANKSVLHKLQMVQHVAAQLILKCPRSSSASTGLEALHLLPIHKRILFKILIITFRIFHSSCPHYLRSRFSCHVPCRTLRSSNANLLQPPAFRYVSKGGKSIAVLGTKAWNQLPTHLHFIQSENLFRKTLKTWIFTAPDALCRALI